MSTELKLFIGEKHAMDDNEAMADFNAKYGRGLHTLAMIDLSSVDRSVWTMVDKAQAVAQATFEATGDHYRIDTGITDDAGNELNHATDCYGKRIAAIPLTEVKDVLAKAQVWAMSNKGNHPATGYRRYAIALATIEAILLTFPNHEDLVALTYGH